MVSAFTIYSNVALISFYCECSQWNTNRNQRIINHSMGTWFKAISLLLWFFFIWNFFFIQIAWEIFSFGINLQHLRLNGNIRRSSTDVIIILWLSKIMYILIMMIEKRLCDWNLEKVNQSTLQSSPSSRKSIFKVLYLKNRYCSIVILTMMAKWVEKMSPKKNHVVYNDDDGCKDNNNGKREASAQARWLKTSS